MHISIHETIIPCCDKSKEWIRSSELSGIIVVIPSGLYFDFYSPIYKHSHLYIKIFNCPNCCAETVDHRKEFLRSMLE